MILALFVGRRMKASFVATLGGCPSGDKILLMKKFNFLAQTKFKLSN